MTRRCWRFLAGALIAGSLSACAAAQDVRYELGHRVRDFEWAWDGQPEASKRLETTPLLKQAVTAFFSMRMTEAAKLLDEGTFRLTGQEDASTAQRWTRSLAVTLDSRLIDSTAGQLGFGVRPLYDLADVPQPAASFQAFFAAGEADPQPLAGSNPVKMSLSTLPATGQLPIATDKTGDLWFVGRVSSGDASSTTAQRVAVVPHLNERLEKLRAVIEAYPTKAQTLEQATVANLSRLLRTLAEGKTPETDYPAARLLAEAEQVAAADKPYYDATHVGQYWLSVPTERGVQHVRLLVPPDSSREQPRPLVVALHGAGGSENMFFDTYGHGTIVDLCAQRGWYLVAPRSAGMGLSPAALIVAALAERYPIDLKRVFLVGHSMGAAQATVSACQSTSTYAAVAALGGGGTITKDAQLGELPFLVGIGTEDFAYTRAKQLYESLQRAGAKRAELREYPQIEHLSIVQVALPDVFALFDRVAAEAR